MLTRSLERALNDWGDVEPRVNIALAARKSVTGQMIPKLFHQYWTDPRDRGRAVPPDITLNCESWTTLYPEYAHSLWSDVTLPELLSDVNGLDVWSHVTTCRLPAMRADIVRLGLVFQLGGFWVDLKNLARERLPNDLLEQANPLFVEHPGLEVRTIPKGFVSNSFFGAPPGSATVFDALHRACANVALRTAGDIFETTGPSLLNTALRENREAVESFRILDSGAYSSSEQRLPITKGRCTGPSDSRQRACIGSRAERPGDMLVVGINSSGYVSSAAVVRDGELAFAAAEERYDRRRYSKYFPWKAIQAGLSYIGASLTDVDTFAVATTRASA